MDGKTPNGIPLVNGTIPFEVRQQMRTGCYDYIEGFGTPYGYPPSLAAGIVFLVLFGLTMVAQTIQMAWKRTWWCSVFAVGSLSKQPTPNVLLYSTEHLLIRASQQPKS